VTITEPTDHQPEHTPRVSPELQPVSAAADVSIIAYQAFVADHDPDVSRWAPSNFAAFRSLSAKVATRVRRQADDQWVVLDSRTGQPDDRVFGSAVAAATWLELNGVLA
jgi:hypothetical protein